MTQFPPAQSPTPLKPLRPLVLNTFEAQDSVTPLNRAVALPEPNPQSSSAADAAMKDVPSSHNNISPADWDDLFLAVQERLRNCVDDTLLVAPELRPTERQAVMKTTVLQCIEAMQQLHAALTLERKRLPRKDSEARPTHHRR